MHVNRQQIEDRNYIAKLKVDDMRNIIKYGIKVLRYDQNGFILQPKVTG